MVSLSALGGVLLAASMLARAAPVARPAAPARPAPPSLVAPMAHAVAAPEPGPLAAPMAAPAAAPVAPPSAAAPAAAAPIGGWAARPPAAEAPAEAARHEASAAFDGSAPAPEAPGEDESWARLDDARRGTAFRSFLREAIAAAVLPPSRRPAALRKTMADHPLVLLSLTQQGGPARLTESAGLEDLAEAADGASQPDPLAFAQDLVGKGLERSELGFAAPAAGALPRSLRRALLENAARHFALAGRAERVRMLRSLPDDVLQDAATGLRAALERVQTSKLDAASELSDAGRDISLSFVSRDQMRELIAVTLRYYDLSSLADKARLLDAILSLPPGAPRRDQLGAALRRTGPAMQKFFQLMAHHIPPKIAPLFSDLLEGTEPEPWPRVEAALRRSFDQPLETIFRGIDRVPLKSGTVAQIHRAVLKDGTRVVVKIIRPGARGRAKRDRDVLLRASAGTTLQRGVDLMTDSMMREFSMPHEAGNMRLADAYRAMGAGASRLAPARPIGPDVLVLLEVPGESMQTALGRRDPALVGRALHGAFRTWVRHAFSRGGFHADPHGGNIFYDAGAGVFIDFGAIGELSPLERAVFLEMAMAILARSPAGLAEAMERAAAFPPGGKALFLENAERILDQELDFFLALNKAMNAAHLAGYDAPQSLILFSRGLEFFQQQYAAVDRRLGHADPGRRARRFDPMSVLFSSAGLLLAAVFGLLRWTSFGRHLVANRFRLIRSVLRLAAAAAGNAWKSATVPGGEETARETPPALPTRD